MKKKKARQMTEKVLRPDKDLPAERMVGRRHCSSKVTKQAMTTKKERQANAAERQVGKFTA